ncbi:membrane-spanning 4-domains subfamily A member 15-like [Colossoma macropomum]|uniref:membrane-spanning 4-domains subfamily A member 15-like n=1 Tax=Colossoma macropomum TaxID=42526 RepID=UPI001863DA2E|nr:membrane-spanning 4-domains subfamily A member 15-like [Colossoma macropomum]
MSAGTVPVITHVITQTIPTTQVMQNVTGQVLSTATPVQVSSVGNSSPPGFLVKFLKGEPKALGTVQIMIGVFTILSAFVVIRTAFVDSGIAFWGALIYISTGSLTVAAEKKLNPCTVKGSLGMNVISAITAGIAVFILSADLITGHICYHYSNSYSYSSVYCVSSYVLLTILLIFTLLEFCISISISAFGCKATCSSQPMVMFVVSNPNVTDRPLENPPQYQQM